MKKGKKGFTLTAQQQDWAVGIGLIIVSLFAVILKIGLPIVIEQPVKDFYNIIEDMPDKSVLLWASDTGVTGKFYQMPTDMAIYNHLLDQIREHDIKLIIVNNGIGPLGVPMIKYYFEKLNWEGLTYGEDYVWLGWIPGMESTLAGLADDIWKIAPTDFYGTSIEEIPMMKDIKSAENIDYMIFSSGTNIDPYIRQWAGKVDKMMAVFGIPTLPQAMPYIERGMIDAYLTPLQLTAEYEKISGRTGLGVAFVDSNSLIILYSIFVVIVSNIIYIVKGRHNR